MMRHIFLDVEAFGPPGNGQPFAFGAAQFDLKRGVYKRRQWKIHHGEASIAANPDTMAWLSQQGPEVLAQLRNGATFGEAWLDFIDWCLEDLSRFDKALTFWADDWSDFAWLDIEARRLLLTPLRELGCQVDSSAITMMAEPTRPSGSTMFPSPQEADEIYKANKTRAAGLGVDVDGLIPHVAMHDAIRGALDLIHVLKREQWFMIDGLSLPPV